MDSPVRKMLKRNDYNRHKLLRKIRRLRRAQVEQQKVAAEKELKRRLRVTPPKFGDGKDPQYKANTFAGRVTGFISGDQDKVNTADQISSVISMVPLVGLVPSSLDLGYDSNRLYHNRDYETAKDVGMDALSMIPLMPKVRFNLAKKAVDPMLYTLLNIYKKYGKYVNKGLWGVKGADAYLDAVDHDVQKHDNGKEPTLLDADKVRMNEQGLFLDEVGNIVGDSVVLPELTVRAHKGYKSAYDREMLDNTVGTALDFVPGIGDAKQGAEALDALNKGNYKEAMMLGGLLALPNVIEKPLKYAKKGVLKFVRNKIDDVATKDKGRWRIANDLILDPVNVFKEYRNGYYPITRKQQKEFINRRKGFEQLWIDQAVNLEKELALKRYRLFTDYHGLPSPLYDAYNTIAPVRDIGGRIGSSRSFAKRADLKGIDGVYSNGIGTINYLNRSDPYSNFNNFYSNKSTFMHEFTHRLQDAGQGFMSGNRYLKLSNYNPATGYYTANDGLYNLILATKNNHPFDVLLRNSDETVYKMKKTPKVKGNATLELPVHHASPDEAIADWRGYRLANPIESAEIMLGKQNAISDYMYREYGLSADDLITLHNSGYDKGKSPKIITKKK